MKLDKKNPSTVLNNPVVLKKLKLNSFRNVSELNWNPGRFLNVIHGKNGAGKSSVIEAIYYLSMLRSFRGAKTEELIQIRDSSEKLSALESSEKTESVKQTRIASVEGIFEKEPFKTTLLVRLLNQQKSSKQLLLNHKKVRAQPQWYSEVPMVLFHPGHVELPSGSPNLRRNYMDRILEQVDPTYCSSLSTYTKALRARNFLLKQNQKNEGRGKGNQQQIKSAFHAYDEILVNTGIILIHTRKKLIEDMKPEIERAFLFILEERDFEIHYSPKVKPDAEVYHQTLQQNFQKDVARGFTGAGPHSDDVEIFFKGQKIKNYASQGQKRAMSLALKLGEVFFLSKSSSKVPILLLDDVSSELDKEKNHKFFQTIKELKCQVFLTTTEPSLIRFEGECKKVHIKEGILQTNEKEFVEL